MKEKVIYLDGLIEKNCICTSDNFNNFTGYYYAEVLDGNTEVSIRGHNLTSVVKKAAEFPIITNVGRIG